MSSPTQRHAGFRPPRVSVRLDDELAWRRATAANLIAGSDGSGRSVARGAALAIYLRDVRIRDLMTQLAELRAPEGASDV